jgi:hypothetical protein
MEKTCCGSGEREEGVVRPEVQAEVCIPMSCCLRMRRWAIAWHLRALDMMKTRLDPAADAWRLLSS